MTKGKNYARYFLTTGSTLIALCWAARVATAQPCGNIGYTGCCVDDNTSHYCSKGTLKTKDCTASPNTPKCGWSDTNHYYTCGTAGGDDPSGTYPRLCTQLPDGGIPDPDSGTKKDTGGTTKDAGTKKDSGSGVPCGEIKSQGCCDGETVYYCTKSGLLTKDCSGTPSCGWDDTKHFYTCGTAGAADPNNQYPMSCSSSPSKDSGSILKDSGGLLKDGAGLKDSGTKLPDGSSIKKDSSSSSKSTSDNSGCSCTVGTHSTAGLLFTYLMAGVALLLSRKRRCNIL
jgi:MYXO-CTERM domain-containing protein